MGKRSNDSTRNITVGCRVQTTDLPPTTGVVVEDFGDLAGEHVVIDRERVAHARRWAVLLDNGMLVFRDDDSVQVIE
jgi:hypothetical protein